MTIESEYINYKYTHFFEKEFKVRFIKTTFIIFCGLILVPHAYAADKGFYAGLYASYQQLDITNQGAIDLNPNSALGAYAGYNLFSMFGIELGYTEFSAIDSDDRDDLELQLSRAHLGFNFQGAVTDTIDLFAKVKATYNYLDLDFNQRESDTSDDIGWQYEVGSQWYINPNFGLTLAIAYAESGYDEDFDYNAWSTAFGVQANF